MNDQSRPATTSEKRISAAFCVIVAIILMAAAFLSGCATEPLVYRESSMPDAGEYRICLRVTLTETEPQATAICQEGLGLKGAAACYMTPIIEKWTPRIVAPRPRSFNDGERLGYLGHELIHALGGRHE